MTKLFASIPTGATIAAAAPAVAEDIIVVAHGQASDPFRSVVRNDVQKAGEDTDAHVEFRSPETFGMVQTSQLIDAAVNQEPDGRVVSIADGGALGPSIERAVAAGIPVISIASCEAFGRDVTIIATQSDPTKVESKVRAALDFDPEMRAAAPGRRPVSPRAKDRMPCPIV